VVFGTVGEILNVCGWGSCQPIERYVVFKVGAGLVVAGLTAAVLFIAGLWRRPS
jgi:hypothetical protein